MKIGHLQRRLPPVQSKAAFLFIVNDNPAYTHSASGPPEDATVIQLQGHDAANDPSLNAQPARTAIPLPGPDASGDDLFRMGLLYSTGQGGAPLDYVSAHMLFNLAAMRGSEEAKQYRRELSAEMDRDSVAEAQRAAREWLACA